MNIKEKTEVLKHLLWVTKNTRATGLLPPDVTYQRLMELEDWLVDELAVCYKDFYNTYKDEINNEKN
jgi:hypothetical protein